MLNHAALAWQTLRGVLHGDHVIVREFRNGPLVCFSWFLWPFRKKILLNINGNIPVEGGGRASAIAFRVLTLMRFRFMLLDGQVARDRLLRRFPKLHLTTPLFCVQDRREAISPNARRSSRFRLGLVGNFRAEKGGLESVRDTIHMLADVPNVEIAIGYRDNTLKERLPKESVLLRYTGARADYIDFVRSCDAMLFFGDAAAYQVRHSGALLDCLGQRVPSIAPDFLLFRSVLSFPCSVGITYRRPEEIRGAVETMISRRAEFATNFEAYFVGRGIRQLQGSINALWDN
jgi:hypothetical protein